MHRSLLLPLIFLLPSCDSDSDSNDKVDYRDLNEAITFTDLIDKRMQNDNSIDGQFILITTEVNAYFNQSEGCADNPALPPICTEELYSTEVTEPIYKQSSGVGACSGYGIELTNSDLSEKLHIDLDANQDFFSLNEEYNVPVNFYAKVEFIELNVSCSDQVNFGITFTLQKGEEAYLLGQLK